MSNLAERSARAARAAVDAAMRDEYDRRTFTVAKFGRHRYGYLHALVRLNDGQEFYFHRRYGSWLAPGTWKGRSVMKEPEALLGSQLGQAVKYELARISQKFQPTITEEVESDDADTGGDDPAGSDDGLSEARDQEHAPDEVQPDGA